MVQLLNFNDWLINDHSVLQVNDTTEEDPENSDQVSRSHSLGDLTSGLTLSLTGQKKADSMLNLSQFPNNVRKLNHTASSSVGARHQKDHRTNVRTNEIKTPKTERTGFQGHSQGRQEYNFSRSWTRTFSRSCTWTFSRSHTRPFSRSSRR